MTTHVVARHGLDAEQLENRLYEFNKAATGYYDGADLGFVIEDGPVLIGGAAGYTWGGICEIRYLWVHADHRRRGLGSALLKAAIAEARERGCRLMFLSSHSFQAPEFYLRHGFEILATIPRQAARPRRALDAAAAGLVDDLDATAPLQGRVVGIGSH